jgi:hypothetical protein
VIKLKLSSKLGGSAVVSLTELTTALYHARGKRVMAVVELAHIDRNEPAPGEDEDPWVLMQIKAIEVARGDAQEKALRAAADAIHLHRTATGSIDEELSPQMSERTIAATAGVLDKVEAARLRVALEQWAVYIDRVTHGKLTQPQAMEELRTVRKGLEAAITWGADRAPLTDLTGIAPGREAGQ